jgi:hypothetical protein
MGPGDNAQGDELNMGAQQKTERLREMYLEWQEPSGEKLDCKYPQLEVALWSGCQWSPSPNVAKGEVDSYKKERYESETGRSNAVHAREKRNRFEVQQFLDSGGLRASQAE